MDRVIITTRQIGKHKCMSRRGGETKKHEDFESTSKWTGVPGSEHIMSAEWTNGYTTTDSTRGEQQNKISKGGVNVRKRYVNSEHLQMVVLVLVTEIQNDDDDNGGRCMRKKKSERGGNDETRLSTRPPCPRRAR